MTKLNPYKKGLITEIRKNSILIGKIQIANEYEPNNSVVAKNELLIRKIERHINALENAMNMPFKELKEKYASLKEVCFEDEFCWSCDKVIKAFNNADPYPSDEDEEESC